MAETRRQVEARREDILCHCSQLSHYLQFDMMNGKQSKQSKSPKIRWMEFRVHLVDYLVVFSVGDMRRKHVILGSAVS